MSCNIRRWAALSADAAPKKAPNTAAAKEMEDRLAKMKAEREKQDTMWNESTTQLTTPTRPQDRNATFR